MIDYFLNIYICINKESESDKVDIISIKNWNILLFIMINLNLNI